jgi:hypothetical protein
LICFFDHEKFAWENHPRTWISPVVVNTSKFTASRYQIPTLEPTILVTKSPFHLQKRTHKKKCATTTTTVSGKIEAK